MQRPTVAPARRVQPATAEVPVRTLLVLVLLTARCRASAPEPPEPAPDPPAADWVPVEQAI